MFGHPKTCLKPETNLSGTQNNFKPGLTVRFISSTPALFNGLQLETKVVSVWLFFFAGVEKDKGEFKFKSGFPAFWETSPLAIK